MTCDKCPDSLVCWGGLLERHPCLYCNCAEIWTRNPPRTVRNINGLNYITYQDPSSLDILVRSCPLDAPAPENRFLRKVICNRCRRLRRYNVLRSNAAARSYHYEEYP